ncbi:MAG: cytochrome c3 family protein [Eggerthellaceae bacterium]|nr:cytochrome c3 family protein [Eggerthellaceae bacterium]
MVKSDEVKETEAVEGAAPQKKRSPKLFIILGSVAVVIAAAVTGFLIWHSQPTFCNDICHTPMDPYLDTFSQEVGVPGHDKWGNEVSNTSAMLAPSLAANGYGCLDCHTPTLGQQIHEAILWVSGDMDLVANATYTNGVLRERNLAQLAEATGADPVSMCMNPTCHATLGISDMASLAAATAELYPNRNPHAGHRWESGELTCSDCHKSHRASVMLCASCHNDAPLPDGWITPAQEKQLAQSAPAKK